MLHYSIYMLYIMYNPYKWYATSTPPSPLLIAAKERRLSRRPPGLRSHVGGRAAVRRRHDLDTGW